MVYPYENAGILGASAANRIPYNIGSNFMLKGYQGSDYNMPRFASGMGLSWEEQLANSIYNERAGMTRVPDMHTGKWFSTDPGYAQGFTTQAEVPIVRSINYDIPVELSKPGQSKPFNQLFNEQANVALDFGTPYNKGSNLHKLITQVDTNLGDYYNTDPLWEYDAEGNRSFRGTIPTQSELKEWQANKPTKVMTQLEKNLLDFNTAKDYGQEGFYSTSRAWPYGTTTPYGEWEYGKEFMDMTKNDLLSMDMSEAEVDEFIENRNKPVLHGKTINAPDLHFTAAGQDALKHGRINYPLSLQAALGQHINQDNLYYHRGEPNLSKAPLNTWRGAGQFLNTAKDITKAKAADTWQSLKANLSPKNSAWRSWINNPAAQTIGKGLRFAGGAGDVALGAMAYSDVMGGTNFVGDSVRDVNKMMRVPFRNDGTVQTSIRDYRNSQAGNTAAVGQQGGAPVRRFSTGGIASLMI